MKTKILIALSLLSFVATGLYAQIAINNTAANPDASAILDLNSGNAGVNKGFLPPQVSLTSVSLAAPVTSPATGLIVYSPTAPEGGSGAGYYFWSGTAWVNLSGAAAGGVTGTGASNYLTKWTGTSTLGQAVIYDNGLGIGVGVPALVGIEAYVRASRGTAVNGYTSDRLGFGLSGFNSDVTGTGVYGAGNTYGIYGDGSYYGTGSGGFFYNGTEQATLADINNKFGINAYGSVSGGFFNNPNNSWAYAAWKGYGVYGYSNTTYSQGAGVYGEDNNSYGVWGVNRYTSGVAINGDAAVDHGEGVQGRALTKYGYPIVAWNNYMGGQTASSMIYTLCSHSGSVVQINYYDGGTQWKITGSGSVGTTVRTPQGGEVRLAAPEAPEIYFEDYGQGQLVNGRAHITLDATMTSNITVNDRHPLRIFVQLENNESCKGVVVKNKTATGFDVVELDGGTSNTPFEWHMVANRADQSMQNGVISHNADVRFAKVNTEADAELRVNMERQKLVVPPPQPAAPAVNQPVKVAKIQGANGSGDANNK